MPKLNYFILLSSSSSLPSGYWPWMSGIRIQVLIAKIPRPFANVAPFAAIIIINTITIAIIIDITVVIFTTIIVFIVTFSLSLTRTHVRAS